MPRETLLLSTQAGPLVVQVPSGSVLFDRPGTVASLGGSWLLSATPSSGSTLLETVDGADAEPASDVRLDGTLDVRVVSESGAAVALTDPLPDGWDPEVPLPRSRTPIVVADPTGAEQPRTYDLRGNFEPEAFSTDDRQLFMIQHLPAEAPTVYRVTVLDLKRGRVYPVFGPYKTPPERMPGIRLQQIISPNADQLYTLYSSARPGYAPHHAAVPNDATVSFVHVLSLQEGWAHCVGLPEELWDRPASEQAMATSPNGRLLYIVDATLGLVTVMDTASLEIRTAPIDLAVPGVRHTSAVVSRGRLGAVRRRRRASTRGSRRSTRTPSRSSARGRPTTCPGSGSRPTGSACTSRSTTGSRSWTPRAAPSWPASRSPAPPRSNG